MLQWIINFFFPAKCPFCGEITQNSAHWCGECSLPWAKEFFFIGEKIWCYTPFWYQDTVKNALLRYKFSGLRQFDSAFGLLMAESPLKELPFDYITWVPLSKKRLRKRGYNQAELLARVVAEECGITPCDCLVKLKDTPAQSGLSSGRARFANAQGVYGLGSASVRGAHILLVDDVITTGSTLQACEKILRDGGAAKVVCLGFARARK